MAKPSAEKCKRVCCQCNRCFQLEEAALRVFWWFFFSFFSFFSFHLEFKSKGVLARTSSLSLEFFSITDFSSPKLQSYWGFCSKKALNLWLKMTHGESTPAFPNTSQRLIILVVRNMSLDYLSCLDFSFATRSFFVQVKEHISLLPLSSTMVFQLLLTSGFLSFCPALSPATILKMLGLCSSTEGSVLSLPASLSPLAADSGLTLCSLSGLQPATSVWERLLCTKLALVSTFPSQLLKEAESCVSFPNLAWLSLPTTPCYTVTCIWWQKSRRGLISGSARDLLRVAVSGAGVLGGCWLSRMYLLPIVV